MVCYLLVGFVVKRHVEAGNSSAQPAGTNKQFNIIFFSCEMKWVNVTIWRYDSLALYRLDLGRPFLLDVVYPTHGHERSRCAGVVIENAAVQQLEGRRASTTQSDCVIHIDIRAPFNYNKRWGHSILFDCSNSRRNVVTFRTSSETEYFNSNVENSNHFKVNYYAPRVQFIPSRLNETKCNLMIVNVRFENYWDRAKGALA